MTLPQLVIISGLAVSLVLMMGIGGLLIISELVAPPVYTANLVAETAQPSTDATATSWLAFPTFPPSWTPTFTATVTNTRLPTLTNTATMTRSPLQWSTPIPTSTPLPTSTSIPIDTPIPDSQPVAAGSSSGSGFQYQFSYTGRVTYPGPVETFGSGAIKVIWTYAGNQPSNDEFAIMIQRQYDQEIYPLVQTYGPDGSGEVEFRLPAPGDYRFLIVSLADSWRLDIYFMAG